MLEDISSIPDVCITFMLVAISDWPTLVSSVCYASRHLPPLIEILCRDQNNEATIHPDPSRDIYIIGAYITLWQHINMAAHTQMI